MKKILFIATVLISLTACQKNQSSEKKLYSTGGIWKIKQYSWSQGPSVSHGMADDSYNDCGTMDFNKNGSGKLTFKTNNYTNVTSFVYSVAGDKLTMVADGETIVYDLSWSKNAFTIEYYRPASADYTIPYKSKKYICKKR